ncbi:MAG: 50S ribosomal protein L22 [Verrucomicrobiaceae bacterium]|nr:50S ribosomal protein L22 [Verrucomicrobiaceae bacterium]
MEVRSVHRYARISSQKARQVTRAITGMPVSQALNVLDFTPKKAAQLIGKVLRTAIANAENNHELDTEDMVVRSAVATPGPTLKRITPRARGSAGAIKKRLCHITVVLAAGKEESDEGSSTTKAAVKKATPRKRPAAKKAEQA